MIRNEEKVFPIFYKKKVLPLEKTKQLQDMMDELKQDSEKIIAYEELMLGKIREKDDKFIKRLEDHLESFKMAGIEKIILKPDFLPVWFREEKSTDTADDKLPMTDDDTTDRLVEWHNTVATFVDLQRDEVNQILSDWFSQMDKIANEGELDPEISCKECVDKARDDSENTWGNAFWYIGFILVCLLNIFIYYKPEDIKECVDGGFYKCVVPNLMKVCGFLRDHYLKFHNITLDYPSIALENSSTNNLVQYSTKYEL